MFYGPRSLSRFPRLSFIMVVALLVLPSIGLAQDTVPEGTSLKAEVTRDSEPVVLDLPLKETRVNSQISGFLASVEVQQTYVNTHDEPLEAIYTFPLPNEASIHEMIMKINDRLVIGELKEEEQAREDYEEAKEEGKRASLLEQERPNVFTQSVANIMPGDTVQIVIRYSEIMEYEGGQYTSVIPAVIGPRYTPGTPKEADNQGEGFADDTDRVPDASRVTPEAMGPDVTSEHELSVNVDLDAGFPIANLGSPSHRINVERDSTETASVSLAPGDTVPNKDFILNYSLDLDEPMVSAMFHQSFLGGYMSLILQPQTSFEDQDITPKDLIFVLDKSGSMSGQRMETLKQAVDQSIGNLRSRDRFKLILFDNDTQTWKDKLVHADADNKQAARKWIRGQSGGGGTEMLKGLKQALKVKKPGEDRVQIMLFMTDGQISNEDEILSTVKNKRGNSRVFTMGIGDSPNRHVLDEMANLGRGSSSVVQFDDNPQRTVGEFFSKISNPYLVDLEIQDPDGVLSETLPNPLPDLFVEEPLYVVSKYDEGGRHPITIQGQLGGDTWGQTLDLEFPEREQGNKAISRLWARKKIQDLMRQSLGEPEDDIRSQIVDISKQYSVLSDYTSFVAVDQKIVRNPDETDLKTKPIPVELPADMQPEGVPQALVQAETSRKRSKPGDPVLTVDAPANARDVIARFPGFGRETLEYDGEADAWTTRFLLPRSFSDDAYPVSVKIIRDDGSVQLRSTQIMVDSVPPRFEVQYLGPGADENTHRLAIDPEKIEQLRTAPADGIQVNRDLRRFVVRYPDGSKELVPVDELTRLENGRLELGLTYDNDGEPFEVTIEAMDWARNRHEVAFTVIPR